MGLRAKSARIIRAGQEMEVPIEDVLVGDVIIVRPGEKILWTVWQWKAAHLSMNPC